MRGDPAIQEKLRKYVKRWNGAEGNLIMILHAIQEDEGYVPREWSIELAKELNTPLARIYEVLTFYHYFRQKPQGKHKIQVCMGTACHVKGGDKILEAVTKELNVQENETTADRQFSVDVVRCIGACGLAPAVVIDGETISRATPEIVLEKIKSLMS